MRLARPAVAAVFAGDRRVWRAALLAAVPIAALLAYYGLRPRDYYTGTNSVEAYGFVAQPAPGASVCVPGLTLPSGTARLRLAALLPTARRPALALLLRLAGGRTITSRLGPAPTRPGGVSAAVFDLPGPPAHANPASLCVSADGPVNWAGSPALAPPARDPPTLAGVPISGRIAIWYLPRAGARRSYLAELGAIVHRASLFRAGFVGGWLFVVLLGVLVPGLALAAVRCLALAAAGRERRLGAWLLVIASLNFACWALISPSFHAPDEVDHFAYTQSLVERGEAPARDSASRLARWSSAENLALEDSSFFTDHQVGDTRPPWSVATEHVYRADVARLHPRGSDGGGYETAATHGPIYYAALAPAYLAASSSPFSQLTLMRLSSALIGALTVLFTYLLVRELAPRLPVLAVLAALLVAFQPMYGFISGSVNNDVGVNAGAAALELLLIRMLRRGVTVRSGALTGVLLLLLPVVKGTAYSLYAVAAVAFAMALWRHHRREHLPGWAALVAGAAAARALSAGLGGVLRPSSGNTPGSGAVSTTASSVVDHPLGYLAYVWQVLLPRLPFMAPHWESTNYPGFVIFVERGWGAFGWYDVFFRHWVYIVIFAAMLATAVLGLVAARREWATLRRRLPELAVLLLTPLAVIAGFEAAFYTPGTRPVVAEFGRYTFPAIAPLAALVAGALLAFGRRRLPLAAGALATTMIGLSYAGQLVTMTGFYA